MPISQQAENSVRKIELLVIPPTVKLNPDKTIFETLLYWLEHWKNRIKSSEEWTEPVEWLIENIITEECVYLEMTKHREINQLYLYCVISEEDAVRLKLTFPDFEFLFA